MKRKLFLIIVVWAAVLIPVVIGHAKPFYEGKVIQLIVTTKPGGGFDSYARLLAGTMEKYLPGSTIIVKNVPGAGHIIGTNLIYEAKPNGLTFGTFERSLVATQVAGLKGVKFDLSKMSWLGSPASDPRAFVVAKHTSYQTLDEAIKSKERIRFAASGIGTTDYLDPVLIAKMLGAEKWQIITGYAGQEDQLAMIRGEIDAVVTSWSNGKSFIESGEGRVLMFNNDTPVSGYEEYPLLKDIVAKEYQPLIDLLLFMVMFNRPFAGPPDIPPDRLAVLREAFRKTWHDPELLKKAEMMKRPINYIGYAEGEKLIKNALNQPPEVVKLIKEAYGK
ncbi:MAG: tripartite tricarboxylate transporter substrate-binding protein [Desulfobacterales bacterium]|nr:tripartite tricarboxylate transporter substrate-binding protein [Desulfobacterales bacterium]